MAEILSTVSLVSFIVAGISFVFALFFWIHFNIPSVIGYLSGRTIRKSIAKTRANNEASGNKSYRPSETNVNRGKLTDGMLDSSNEISTERISDNQDETEILMDAPVAENDAIPTELLQENKTSMLYGKAEANHLGTETQEIQAGVKKQLNMLEDIIFIHTDEQIDE